MFFFFPYKKSKGEKYFFNSWLIYATCRRSRKHLQLVDFQVNTFFLDTVMCNVLAWFCSCCCCCRVVGKGVKLCPVELRRVFIGCLMFYFIFLCCFDLRAEAGSQCYRAHNWFSWKDILSLECHNCPPDTFVLLHLVLEHAAPSYFTWEVKLCERNAATYERWNCCMFWFLHCQGECFLFGTVNQKAAHVDAAQSNLAQLTI